MGPYEVMRMTSESRTRGRVKGVRVNLKDRLRMLEIIQRERMMAVEMARRMVLFRLKRLAE